jgi:hypothetical protein
MRKIGFAVVHSGISWHTRSSNKSLFHKLYKQKTKSLRNVDTLASMYGSDVSVISF